MNTLPGEATFQIGAISEGCWAAMSMRLPQGLRFQSDGGVPS